MTAHNPPITAVRDAVARALSEDLLPLGDITASLIDPNRQGELEIRARKPGVVAGQRCAEEAFAQVDGRITVTWLRNDGSLVEPGDVVAEVVGPLASVLTAERTALNFLCHLSGVATLTWRFVDAVSAANPNTRIIDTRKTTPGLRALEKAAVRAGGGNNHRGNLSEAVLVKDNHLGGLGITAAVSLAQSRWPGRMIEVECESMSQVAEAVRAGATVVMLDNMSPAAVGDCVDVAHSEAKGFPILVEVSGGVTLDSAPHYAAAGADLISVGALTHSAPALDFGLDLTLGGAAGIDTDPDAAREG